MSYSYSLFIAPAPGPMEQWPATQPEPIGTVEEVKRMLSTLYPDMEWKQSHGSWFSLATADDRHPECQITPETNGDVCFLTMRRVERYLVEAACSRLGTVAVDAQTIELYSPQEGRWVPAG